MQQLQAEVIDRVLCDENIYEIRGDGKYVKYAKCTADGATRNGTVGSVTGHATTRRRRRARATRTATSSWSASGRPSRSIAVSDGRHRPGTPTLPPP